MDRIKRFMRTAFMSYKSIYGWMSLKTFLFMVILVPFAQTALFSYLNYYIRGEAGMRYAALGNSLFTICIAVVFSMATSITQERRLGTLQIVLMTPTNRLKLFLTKSMLHIVEAVITCIFSLILGIIFFKLNFTGINVGMMMLIIIYSAAMMIGVGCFAGAIGLLFRKATPILNSIYLLLMLLCGVNFSVSDLPVFMQYISNLIPLTYGIKTLNDIYNGGAVSGYNMLMQLVTGIVFLAVSYVIFVGSEKYCIKHGTLDYY